MIKKRRPDCGGEAGDLAALAERLLKVPPGRRGAMVRAALSFAPEITIKGSFAIGPLRASLANCWEARFCEPVPVAALRELLEPPIHISIALQFGKFHRAEDLASATEALAELLDFLKGKARQHNAARQDRLLADEADALADNKAETSRSDVDSPRKSSRTTIVSSQIGTQHP